MALARALRSLSSGASSGGQLVLRQSTQVAGTNTFVWPELPPALTAIIGTREHLGHKGSAALKHFVRQSREFYHKGNFNRSYINLLSSFSCAPKAQTVIWGLPFLVSLSRQSELSCYSAKLGPKTYPSTGLLQKGLVLTAKLCLQKLSLLLRGLFLSAIFTPILIGAPFALHFDVGREFWNRLVRKSLELAGPAFVKWGQWASTRRDMFPGDLCEELSHLYTSVPSHNYSHTKKLVEAAFGQKLEDVFEFFETEPCASGSIAQVHKAKLSAEGAKRINMEENQSQMVAVKVRHPNVESKLLRDFELMLIIADLASHLADAHIIGESVRQFRGPLIEQLDLAHEAEALCKFNCNFKKHKDVSFPRPLYPYVSNDVLVETFEEGIIFNEIFGEEQPWNRKLAQMGLNTLFKMLLEDNFVHADLHPGNILIRFKEPDFWSKVYAGFFGYEKATPRPHIVMLDTGMSTSLNKKDRQSLFQFFEFIGRLDGGGIAETSLKMATIQQFPTKPQFVQEIVELFNNFQKHMRKHDDMPPAAECMSCLLDIFRKHRVGMKSELSVVIATVFMMEGWATQLDPDLKVMKTIRNFTDYNIQQSFAICTV